MYQWHKGIAQWTIDDTIYLSVVFSWDLPEALRMKGASKKRVVIGGPAAKLAGIQTEELPYSALPFHNPLATFTTRGCPNSCAFCAVPRLEGDLVELDDFPIKPVVCDNNLLAASIKHFDRVIDRLKVLPFVDFNQGLEAERFTPYHAKRIKEIKHTKVRFALDSSVDYDPVKNAIEICRATGLNNIGIYVLIGFHDTPEDAKTRLEWVRSQKIRPTPMRYQPLDCAVKNSYVAPKWTEKDLMGMMRYYSRLRWLEHIPYDEYRGYKEIQKDLLWPIPLTSDEGR